MATILVVDDDNIIRSMICKELKNGGYEVLEALDGEKAMELLRNHKVDLSVIDIFLPKKDGLQVISELKKMDKEAKIVAITGGEAFNPETIVELSQLSQVSESFTKPLDLKQFMETVEDLLQK